MSSAAYKNMEEKVIDDLNVNFQEVLESPEAVKNEMPMSLSALEVVERGRKTIKNIIDRDDHRLLVVVGPCSIHDVDAALDYARRLKVLADKVKDTIYIVMRVYFEKPRTVVGWKGLINDPELNNTFNIKKGLKVARKLLLDIAEIGLPTSTEALDPISPQYMQDLISWTAIGARTTESQTHREMASGLSSIVGFKNGTDGGVAVAINALKSTAHPHSFLGINVEGQVAITHTHGNRYGHIVLRGGSAGPNYDRQSVAVCEASLKSSQLPENIMIDCSHANSNKDHEQQPMVIRNVAMQIAEGNKSILGLMLESNIGPGNQSISSHMKYGVSITDKCMSWAVTESEILRLRGSLKTALEQR